MALRAILLKAMLVLLACACGLGVLAVLLSLDVLARLTGTGVVAAICLAVSLLAATRLERADQRSTGVAILAIVIANFCIAMLAIWGELLLGSRTSDELAQTAFAGAGCGVASIALLIMRPRPPLARAAALALGFAGATFAMLLGAIWLGYPVSDNFAQSAGSLAGVGAITSLCCVGVWTPIKNWRSIGVASGGLALVASLIGIWGELDEGAEVFVLLLSVAGVVALAALLALAVLPATWRWLLRAVLVSAIVTALLVNTLSVLTLGFRNSSGLGVDMIAKLVGASAIITACGALAVGVIHVLTRRSRVDFVPAPTSIREVFVRCPHCAHEQMVRANPGPERSKNAPGQAPNVDAVLSQAPSCERCGLLIAVLVATPRCAGCSYELLDIPANAKCPECGSTRVGEAGGQPGESQRLESSQP